MGREAPPGIYTAEELAQAAKVLDMVAERLADVAKQLAELGEKEELTIRQSATFEKCLRAAANFSNYAELAMAKRNARSPK